METLQELKKNHPLTILDLQTSQSIHYKNFFKVNCVPRRILETNSGCLFVFIYYYCNCCCVIVVVVVYKQGIEWEERIIPWWWFGGGSEHNPLPPPLRAVYLIELKSSNL